MKKLACILLAASLLISCKDDAEDIPDNLPEFPTSTFEMDFSITDSKSGGRVLTDDNYWGRSAVIVGFWSTIATAYTIIPVVSFKAAFNQTPRYDIDLKAWVWEYDFDGANNSYSARLEARVSASGVDWKMLISKSGDFEDFVWYTGFSDISGTSGTWTLNADPDDSNPALQIDWTKNSDGTTKSIKYTNVIPGDDNNGGFISFEITDGTDYNRIYTIYNKSTDNTINIEWHKENKNGRIKDPAKYQSSDFFCWDENLDNVACG
ncbi:MAG: hypothetical protein RIG77_01100 [Cyclobacteriaceae bacterium]